MLSAPLAARELDRRRAERAAEAARQLPLHAEPPPELVRVREDDGETTADRPPPDWTTNY